MTIQAGENVPFLKPMPRAVERGEPCRMVRVLLGARMKSGAMQIACMVRALSESRMEVRIDHGLKPGDRVVVTLKQGDRFTGTVKHYRNRCALLEYEDPPPYWVSVLCAAG